MAIDSNTRKIHLGNNVKRIRETIGMKQEALAIKLGGDWNQKKVSALETKEEIDEQLLEQIAQALNMPVDAVKNYDPEKVIYNIQNNFDGSNNQGDLINNYQPIINNSSEDSSLLKEKDARIAALELLLKEKDERITVLQKMISILEKGKTV